MRSEKIKAAIEDYESKVSAWRDADSGPHSQATVDHCRADADAALLVLETAIQEDAQAQMTMAFKAARVGCLEADLTQAKNELAAQLESMK